MIIFNFHHIEPELRTDETDRRYLSMTPQGLRNFIRLLRQLGFNIVSFRDVLKAGGPEWMSKKDVILTFDDGYENNYLHAAPVLVEERCPATIFILPGMLGGTNNWDYGHLPQAERDRLMTKGQMKILAQTGLITFGSHGMEHRKMPELSEIEQHRQLSLSWRFLSREFSEAFVPVFAYPWGSYSDSVKSLVARSPFELAVTTEKHRWTNESDSYAIPRYTAYLRDSNPMVLLGKLIRHQILFG